MTRLLPKKFRNWRLNCGMWKVDRRTLLCWGDWGRELAMYLGREVGGLTLAELARRCGASGVSAIGMAISRFQTPLNNDSTLAKKVEKLEAQLWNVDWRNG